MSRRHVEKASTLISRKVTQWGRENFQFYPWRNEQEQWRALSAEVMLQRTRASSVIPVWLDFTERYPDLDSAANADPYEFRLLLRPLGLTWRADLLKKLLEQIREISLIPLTKEELIQLPAVGDYVASAFLSLHASQRAVIIDANVVRWICRMTGDVYDGETRRQKWLQELADKLTPARVFRDYNYGVLDLTIGICKRNPKCSKCPVIKYCCYGNNKH